MDFKIMLTTFGMVFLAELGDKTQLATFCLSEICHGFQNYADNIRYGLFSRAWR